MDRLTIIAQHTKTIKTYYRPTTQAVVKIVKKFEETELVTNI